MYVVGWEIRRRTKCFGRKSIRCLLACSKMRFTMADSGVFAGFGRPLHASHHLPSLQNLRRLLSLVDKILFCFSFKLHHRSISCRKPPASGRLHHPTPCRGDLPLDPIGKFYSGLTNPPSERRYTCTIYIASLVVWRPRHTADISTNWKHGSPYAIGPLS